VAVVESHPGVDTGAERDVALLAGKPFELTGEPTTVSLGNPASQPNILPRAVELASGGSFLGEIEQNIDSLLSDAHQPNGDAAVG
jgi:hypothetical protein